MNASSVADARESRLRSLLKTISYRVLGTITTWLLALLVSGDHGVALAIGALDPLVKSAVYYLHERAWLRVPPGTVRRLLSRET